MTSTRIQHHFDEHEDGTVHTLCVNNPQRLNILNSETMQSLRDCLQTISEDDHARVLILRGSGNKAWIGGADIREMAQLEPGSAKAFISQIHQLCEAIRTLPIPVIAAIRGYCLGAGLEVAVSCDLRLAADNSSYGMPEVRVGLPQRCRSGIAAQANRCRTCSRPRHDGSHYRRRTSLTLGPGQ